MQITIGRTRRTCCTPCSTWRRSRSRDSRWRPSISNRRPTPTPSVGALSFSFIIYHQLGQKKKKKKLIILIILIIHSKFKQMICTKLERSLTYGFEAVVMATNYRNSVAFYWYSIVMVNRIWKCVPDPDAEGVVQLRGFLRDHGSEFPGPGADGAVHGSHYARLRSPGEDQRLPGIHPGTSGIHRPRPS